MIGASNEDFALWFLAGYTWIDLRLQRAKTYEVCARPNFWTWEMVSDTTELIVVMEMMIEIAAKTGWRYFSEFILTRSAYTKKGILFDKQKRAPLTMKDNTEKDQLQKNLSCKNSPSLPFPCLTSFHHKFWCNLSFWT